MLRGCDMDGNHGNRRSTWPRPLQNTLISQHPLPFCLLGPCALAFGTSCGQVLVTFEGHDFINKCGELSNNKENMGEHFKEHYQFAHVVLMTDYTDECLHSFKNWQEWKCWTKDETAASQAIKLVPSIQGKSLPLNKSDVLHEGGNLWRSKLETQSEM